MNEVYLPILLARYGWGWKLYEAGSVKRTKKEAKSWLFHLSEIVENAGAYEVFTDIMTIRRDMFEGLEAEE